MNMRPWVLLPVGLVAALAVACSDRQSDEAVQSTENGRSNLMRTDSPPRSPPVVEVEGKVVPVLAYEWFDNESRTASSLEPGPDVIASSLTLVSAADHSLEFRIGSAVRPSMVNVKFFNGTNPMTETPSEEEGSLTCSEDEEKCLTGVSLDHVHVIVEVPIRARYSVLELFYPNPFQGSHPVFFSTYGVGIEPQ